MGADAQIIGFGPFKKELVGMDLLPYPDDFYDGVEEGTIIIVEFCTCNTSAQSGELANSCGTSLRDFSTHYLGRGEGVKFNKLNDMVKHSGIAEWTDKDVDNLDYLVKLGTFRFFLQPNM